MRQYGVLSTILLSLVSPSVYRDVARHWGGIGASYLFVIVLLFILINAGAIYWKLHIFNQDVIPELTKQIPTIKIEDGQAFVKATQPVYIKSDDEKKLLLVIDTKIAQDGRDEIESAIALYKSKGAQMILTKNYFLVPGKLKQKGQVIELENFSDMAITKESIDKYATIALHLIFAALVPIIFIVTFLYRLVQSMIYAAVGMLFCKILGIQLYYQQTLRLAIVSLTPAVILDLVNRLFDIGLPGYTYLIVAMVYLFYAVAVNRNIS